MTRTALMVLVAVLVVGAAVVLAAGRIADQDGGTQPFVPATCPGCGPTTYTPRAAP